MDLKSLIRTIPDWPKPGIQFRDITTLISHPEGFEQTCLELVELARSVEFDRVVGIESRGFVFASIMARDLKKPMVLARKPGKLPYKTVSEEYKLEYGTAALEIHTDSIEKGEKVIIVDDLLATGGTAAACANLVEKVGAHVAAILFVIDLPEVGGRAMLKEKGYDARFLVEFEGE